MASNGSFTTRSRSATQYPRNATFSWWQNGQSTDGNYTDIGWKFVLGGGTSSNASIAIYTGSITVDGQTWNFNYNGGLKKNGFVLAEGTKRIYHSGDGSKNFSASGGVNIYNTNEWYDGSSNWWLNQIPRGSSGTFNKTEYKIGEKIIINFQRNSDSFTHAGWIQFPDIAGWVWEGQKYFQGVGTTYEWTPTQAEKEMLYGRIPNAQSANMWADCKTMNGGTEISRFSVGESWMKVDPDECSPLFSDYTYADTNSATTAITGDSSVLISGKSTLAVTISAANKATARLSATMSKYTYQIAGLTGEEAYSTSQIVKDMGSPTVAATELPSGTRDLVVTAVDSRGIQTPVTKRVTIVPYTAPSIAASATRANGFENATTIKITGAFSRIEVGGTARNTVNASTGIKYRYKPQSTTTWGSWNNLNATIDQATGKATVADFQISLDNQQAFDIEVQMTDRLETTTAALTVSVGQPAFYIGADGRVGVGGMPTQALETGEHGLLDIKGRAFSNGLRVLTTDDLPATPIDTGWVDITSYIENTYHYAARPGQPPKARRIGNIVYLTGEIYCKVSVGVMSSTLLTNLPHEFAPEQQQTSGSGVQYEITDSYYMIYVEKVNNNYNGQIRISQPNKKIVQTSNWQGYCLSNIPPYIGVDLTA